MTSSRRFPTFEMVSDDMSIATYRDVDGPVPLDLNLIIKYGASPRCAKFINSGTPIYSTTL